MRGDLVVSTPPYAVMTGFQRFLKPHLNHFYPVDISSLLLLHSSCKNCTGFSFAAFTA